MAKKYLLLPTIKHSRESMQENLVIVESPAKAKTIDASNNFIFYNLLNL